MNKNYYFEKLYIWVENNGLLILFIWIHTILSYIAVGTVGRKATPHSPHARTTYLPPFLSTVGEELPATS